MKLLLDNEGYTEKIKQGVIYGLVSSNRPTHEMLASNLLDQCVAFENQFAGMSTIPFSHDDFEDTRARLIEILQNSLTENDKAYLLAFNRIEPDWSIADLQQFPSVQWKLSNLKKFKKTNANEYKRQHNALEKILIQ